MDDIEQSNKHHFKSKSGRKVRENFKSKNDKVLHVDSKGDSIIKRKRRQQDAVNKKAFAIQNIQKAKKKAATVLDHQTVKHSYKVLSSQYLDAPQVVSIVGAAGCGKSTLLRTFLRFYTGHRAAVSGPVTVVTGKTKRITFFECPNDLASMVNLSKVSDTVLLVVDVKKDLQMVILEFIELLKADCIPRIKIIYTHVDERRQDKKLLKKMKTFTKRIQAEVHANPLVMSEMKGNRDNTKSEYKLDDIRQLARSIGEKKPLPNDFRSNHPYLLVDRVERIKKDYGQTISEYEDLKFYGYVRGCTILPEIDKMHLLGVDDIVVSDVVPLPDPCPTPAQENDSSSKRQPLAMKEKKAYAPMCGYGGVLKDAEGFHILSTVCPKSNESSEKNAFRMEMSSDDDSSESDVSISNMIKEVDNSSDEGEMLDGNGDDDDAKDSDENDEQKKNLVDAFDEMENDLKIGHDRINYSKLLYDEEYIYNDNTLNKLQGSQQKLSLDLFVTGTWDENEDASALLKKDDEMRNKTKRIDNSSSEDEDIESEVEDDDAYDSNVAGSADGDDDDGDVDIEGNENKSDIINNDLNSEEESDEYTEDSENDDASKDINVSFKVVKKNKTKLAKELNSDDDNISEDESDDENVSGDESDDENVSGDDKGNDAEESKIDEDESSEKKESMFDGWKDSTTELTEFQLKKRERNSRSKREKKLEKKAKQKALFDIEYDAKQGGVNSAGHFEKWKEDYEKQEKLNLEAFSNLDKEDAYKVAGIKPGAYVCVDVKKVPIRFFDNFNPKYPVVLGGLAPGEETFGVLTGNFKIHRHFEGQRVFKTEDPMIISIGWRLIQSFCYYFKEEHNFRKRYLKYSTPKGVHCAVGFAAPVVPVKTGFVCFSTLENSQNFRVAALGSISSKNDTIDIKKKLKRIGYPAKIFQNTAFIKDMFSCDLEVAQYTDSLIKTTSGIRGAVKKSVQSKNSEYPPGTFRATFEAQILKSDIVFLVCWVMVEVRKICQTIKHLQLKPGETFPYWVQWNRYKRERGIELPARKEDSNYKPIHRQPFIAAPITTPANIVKQLPFMKRPMEPSLEDRIQAKRPKVVLDVEESRQQELLTLLAKSNEERKEKKHQENQNQKMKRNKKNSVEKKRKNLKEKQKRKNFFKMKSIKSGESRRKSKHQS